MSKPINQSMYLSKMMMGSYHRNRFTHAEMKQKKEQLRWLNELFRTHQAFVDIRANVR